MLRNLLLIFALTIIARAQTVQITLHALNGKTGKPIPHQRLVLFSGQTAEEARFHKLVFDLTTDEAGFAKLNVVPAQVKFIAVFVDFMTVCYPATNATQFSTETILSEGLSTPNNCGTPTPQPLQPGRFTIYARPATLRERMAW